MYCRELACKLGQLAYAPVRFRVAKNLFHDGNRLHRFGFFTQVERFPAHKGQCFHGFIEHALLIGEEPVDWFHILCEVEQIVPIFDERAQECLAIGLVGKDFLKHMEPVFDNVLAWIGILWLKPCEMVMHQGNTVFLHIFELGFDAVDQLVFVVGFGNGACILQVTKYSPRFP